MDTGDFAAFTSLRESQRRERERVSRILHDDIGQVLTAAGLELDLILLDYAGGRPDLSAAVTSVQKTLEQAFAKVRSLSHEVHPDPVRRFGFRPVIDKVIAAARARFAGELVFSVEGPGEPPGELGAALCECAGEALDNAIRHGDASRIEIAFICRDDVIQLTVDDDGCGFDAEEASPGTGLFTFSYYQRLGMLYLKLESERGRGTRVTLTSRNRDEQVNAG